MSHLGDTDGRMPLLIHRRLMLYPLLLLLPALAGVTLLLYPLPTMAIVGFLFLAVLAYFVFAEVLVVYFAFILLQDLLTNFVGETSAFYLFVRRGDEGVLLVLLLVTLLRIGLGQVKLRWHPSLTLICIALLGGLVPTIVSPRRIDLAVFDVFLLVKGFIVFFIVSHLHWTTERMQRVLRSILAAGLLALFFAGIDLLFGQAYRQAIHAERLVGYRSGLPSVISIFEHEGLAGWFFAFVTSVSLGLHMVYTRYTYLLLTFGFTCGTLLTLRRKALVGLLVVFLVAIYMSGRWRRFLRTVIITALIVVIVFTVAGDPIIMAFQQLLDIYVFNPNAASVGRNALYLSAFEIATDYFPFGSGFATYGGTIATKYYSPLYYEYGLARVAGMSEDRPAFQQDAFWPHIVAELGFVGSLFFLVALLVLLAQTWALARRQEPASRALGIMACFVILEAFVESVGWVVFEQTFACSCLFGLTAAALAFARDEPGETRALPQGG